MISVTPARLNMLRTVADCGLLTLWQLARLADVSPNCARRHMRVLFDAGLLDVVAVHRAALAPPGAPNDHTLLGGSAPGIFRVTREGSKVLMDAGLMDQARVAPDYGPRNTMFLAHALATLDVRVWLTASAREAGSSRVTRWRDGQDAHIRLPSARSALVVRPDAWFVLELGDADGHALVGLVEADRASERGTQRWMEKVKAYASLFAGNQLRAVTGYANARVIVVTPTARRRDELAAFVVKAAEPALARRFWITDSGLLSGCHLDAAAWRRAGDTALLPLVPTELIMSARQLAAPQHTAEGRDGA